VALISFTGSPHGGSRKLLPEWRSQGRITPIAIIDHSIVGSAMGAWLLFRDSSGLESHFIVRGRRSGVEDGHIWQLMDTGRRADANRNANGYAISIETEDDGDPDTQPWTRAQLQSRLPLPPRRPFLLDPGRQDLPRGRAEGAVAGRAAAGLPGRPESGGPHAQTEAELVAAARKALTTTTTLPASSSPAASPASSRTSRAG
jgi:N-acetylmuramoyl-L-alanine amidase